MSDLSLVRGADQPPLDRRTIGELFDEAVRQGGGDPALVVCDQQVNWSWKELGDRVDRLAGGLVAAGLRAGERIGIWAPNRAEWTLVQFAAAKAGLVLVTINPAYRPVELEHALRTVDCAAIVSVASFKDSDYRAMLADVRVRLPSLRLVWIIEDGLPAGEAPLPDVAVTAGDAANIQFTSGTTGLPKGATLTHTNIVNNAIMVGTCIGLTREDRLCIPVPLYHCFGMVMGNLACVARGATMVYPGAGFDAAATLACVEERRCTGLYGVPTMFIAILDHPDFAQRDLSSLRTGIMAGSPCPETTMRAVMERMHMREVTIAYGMTETSPVSFQTDRDDPLDLRVGTVGRIRPHLEAKLVDAEGETVALGQVGELCVRGYSVMQGYWSDPTATAQAIDADGWMHSGDLATIDAAGYCRIVGRAKDMVIRGGENIYPREIEEHLMTHPDIADAQVVGVSDERYGEELCAWIIVRDGATLDAEGVRAHCRGRIAHYKTPRHVRLVDSFPMTVTGKVRKVEMRRMMELERLATTHPPAGS